MAQPSFAIDLVETGYRLDGTATEWFDRVLAQLAPELERGLGVFAVTYRFEGQRLLLGELRGRNCPHRMLEFSRGMYEHAPADAARLMRNCPGECRAVSEFLRLLPREQQLGFREALAQVGIADGLVVAHPDGEGRWLAFGAYSDRPLRTVPGQRGMWRRLCAHLATAWRLRRRLGTAHATLDAVVSPSGRVLSAGGEAAEGRHRVRLAHAVRSIEKARGALRRRDPLEAMELWKGLVSGRWSLIDRVEADGARVLVAHQNAPHNRDPRGLSSRENAVVELAMTGASNKQIAYALGLSAATVAGHLQHGLNKLGLSTRLELVELGVGRSGATARREAIAGQELDLLVLGDAQPRSDVLEGPNLPLTEAEREVARLVGEGLSNAEIARRRGRSARTIANQVASIFGKVGVGSRAELVLALSRRPVRKPA